MALLFKMKLFFVVIICLVSAVFSNLYAQRVSAIAGSGISGVLFEAEIEPNSGIDSFSVEDRFLPNALGAICFDFLKNEKQIVQLQVGYSLAQQAKQFSYDSLSEYSVERTDNFRRHSIFAVTMVGAKSGNFETHLGFRFAYNLPTILVSESTKTFLSVDRTEDEVKITEGDDNRFDFGVQAQFSYRLGKSWNVFLNGYLSVIADNFEVQNTTLFPGAAVNVYRDSYNWQTTLGVGYTFIQ